jgi:K(+)-stimulated pyrophosphate-energized sodium pump
VGVGVALGVLLSIWFEYFNNDTMLPMQAILGATNFGSRLVLLEGMANGMTATAGPAILSAAAIISARYIGGTVYGISLGTLGALSTLSMHITLDMLSPIANNSRAFMVICHFPKESKVKMASFCRSARLMAAAGRGFVIAAAALSSISLLFTYIEKAGIDTIFLEGNERIIAGTLLGACVPYVFAALPLSSIACAAAAGTTEVLRQLAIPEVFSHTQPPDYTICITMMQMMSLYSCVVPVLLPFVSPFVIGIGLGPDMLVGFLLGKCTNAQITFSTPYLNLHSHT